MVDYLISFSNYQIISVVSTILMVIGWIGIMVVSVSNENTEEKPKFYGLLSVNGIITLFTYFLNINIPFLMFYGTETFNHQMFDLYLLNIIWTGLGGIAIGVIFFLIGYKNKEIKGIYLIFSGILFIISNFIYLTYSILDINYPIGLSLSDQIRIVNYLIIDLIRYTLSIGTTLLFLIYSYLTKNKPLGTYALLITIGTIINSIVYIVMFRISPFIN